MKSVAGAMGMSVVLVIGCSAADETQMNKDTTTTAGVGGSGGSTTTDGGGDAQGGMGGVGGQGGNGGQMGLPPIVVNADCNVTVGNQLFAEGIFVGKTAEELGTVSAIGVFPANPSNPPGYTRLQQWALVQDGRVAASCGTQAAPTFASFQFILPQPER